MLLLDEEQLDEWQLYVEGRDRSYGFLVWRPYSKKNPPHICMYVYREYPYYLLNIWDLNPRSMRIFPPERSFLGSLENEPNTHVQRLTSHPSHDSGYCLRW
jgi:hypothetical protein